MSIRPDNQEAECREAGEALAAYFDGVANEAEQQLAKAHLAHCPSCARMLQEWQSLRLMELEPVKVPRHLKAAILRQTVGAAPPIWQRFWPRLLTGMAVPTLAVGCWLLIVAAPWQQSLPEIDMPQNPLPENRVAAVPENSASTPLSATSKNKPIKTAKPVTANEKKLVSPSHQTESKPVSVSRIKPSSRVATASAGKHTAKSTFTPTPKPGTQNLEPETQIKTPQVSMAAWERPHSRAAQPVTPQPSPTVIAVEAPKPRATEPVLVAALPSEDTLLEDEDDSTNPVLDYIAANDVRPDTIRDAVENYRAALLADGADL